MTPNDHLLIRTVYRCGRGWLAAQWLSAVILAALAACSCGVPPAPTLVPTATAVSGGTFAIYLTDPEIRPDKLAIQSHLELAAEPILTVDDIIGYVWDRHEITLTAAAVERLQALHVPTSGISFVVCLDRAPIYAGAFWAAYSSQSFDGVVIDPILVTPERPVIQVQLGYPSPSFFHGEDPRADSRIRAALQAAGKLQ